MDQTSSGSIIFFLLTLLPPCGGNGQETRKTGVFRPFCGWQRGLPADSSTTCGTCQLADVRTLGASWHKIDSGLLMTENRTKICFRHGLRPQRAAGQTHAVSILPAHGIANMIR